MRIEMAPMEREAYENTSYDGNGWAYRFHQGKRYMVACSVTRYRVIFGYAIDSNFMLNRSQFLEKLGEADVSDLVK